MTLWLVRHAPTRFDDLATPERIRNALQSASIEGDPPHLLISGPSGCGKTAAWRLVARQVLGPGWKATHHVLQARDLSGSKNAMKRFEEFLQNGSSGKGSLASSSSLDAFDRSLWATDDTDPPPSGVEIDLSDGRIPISRLIIIEDADHLGIHSVHLKAPRLRYRVPLHSNHLLYHQYRLALLSLLHLKDGRITSTTGKATW